MKKIIITALLLLIASSSWAAFLVCDPNPQATVYMVTIAGQTQTVPAQPDGSLKFDLAGVSGITSGQVMAGREWVLNGEPQDVFEWSAPVPFSLSGGVVAGGCSGLKIKK